MTNNAYLIEKSSQEKGQKTWAITDELMIGRHPSCDVCLPLLPVSRQHAKITATPQGYFIEDLDSHNGTFVNGKPLKAGPQPLGAGDEIVIGGEVVLLFNDPSETIDGRLLGRMQGIWIDPQTRAVWVDAQPVEPPLSPAQLTLLELLHQNEGQVISHAQLVAYVWPDVAPEGVSKDSINGLIKRLRGRLRKVQPNKDYLEVLRGHGIRLVKP